MSISKVILAGCVRYARAVPPDINGVEVEADRVLVIGAGVAMGEELKTARAKGHGGWWGTDCSIECLKEGLDRHYIRGDMVGVMTFAAMILARESAGRTP